MFLLSGIFGVLAIIGGCNAWAGIKYGSKNHIIAGMLLCVASIFAAIMSASF